MKLFPGELLETKASEEVEAVGEDKDLLKSQSAGFLQTTLNQATADTPALVVRGDHDGADFPQIFPKNVQRSHAQDIGSAVFTLHKVIPHKAVEFGQGTRQNVPPAGTLPQQTIDFRNFLEPGFADHDTLKDRAST
jgi:hypothetical protein